MPRKIFTSFDIAAVTNELQTQITESRVNNIYQLNKQTLLLKLHKINSPPLLLLLEAGTRFHLTSYTQEKPASPPTFCMALRKHLRNAWLRAVKQHEFERIVMFNFESQGSIMCLVLELFGEGNIILTDAEDKILQALTFKRMRDRNILRGETFEFPPSSGRNPLNATLQDIENDLHNCSDNDVVRALARRLSVGGVYAEEILLRAQVEKTKLCKQLDTHEIDSIYNAIQSLSHTVHEGNFEPRIVLDENGDYLDVLPFGLKRYESYKIKKFKTFNDALDDFYLKVTVAEVLTVAGTEIEQLRREAEKIGRIISEQEKVLSETRTMAEANKRFGDLIYAHSAEFEELLEKYKSAGMEDKKQVFSKSESSEITVEIFDSKNRALDVEVDGAQFSISLRKSLFENAAYYYEEGKKARQKATGALAALSGSRLKLNDVEKRIREGETAQLSKPTKIMEELVKRKVQRKAWFEKFRSFVSSDGFLVVAGKDAVSNEVLVKKYVDEDDVVFHAEITGSPFVVVKTEGRLPTEATLREAGEFAAAFSRAWREGMGSADVYWVKREQLSKTGPSGEYVAHGAFFVVGKRNWMRGVPLRLAVGAVFEKEGLISFVGGPVDAVKAQTKVFVTLLPGDMRGKDFLRRILQSLSLKLPKEFQDKVLKSSIECIREHVPYTMGTCLESP